MSIIAWPATIATRLLRGIDGTPVWLRAVAAFVLCVAVQLPLLTTVPQITVDEPWYANTAYNFTQGHGLVNTNTGWRGGDEFFLHTVLLAGFFQISDATLGWGRLFSVLLGALATALFVRLCARLDLRGSHVALGVLLLVFGNVFYMVFRRIRPEVVVVACTILSLFFLVRAVGSDRRGAFFGTGLFVSAACLAHPNGAILIGLMGLAVLGHVVRVRNAHGAVYFICGVALPMTALVVHITQFRDVPLLAFITEMFVGSKRVAIADSGFISGVFANIGLFVGDYSLGIKRAYILIFEVGVLVVGVVVGVRRRELRLISWLGLGYLAIALVFLRPFHRIGFVVVIIFTLVAFLLLLDTLPLRSFARRGLLVAGLLYLGNNVAGDGYVLHRGREWSNYEVLAGQIEDQIPAHATVVCNMAFWFPLRDHTVYTHSTHWGFTSYENLRALLDSGDLDYAVLSDYILDGISPTTGEKTVYPIRHRRFYDELRPYLETQGTRVATIPTHGYGEIEIWKLR